MKPKSLIIMTPGRTAQVYGPEQISRIEELTALIHPPMSAEESEGHRRLLEQVEIIFGGWGTRCLDARFLAGTPALKAVFYAAGSLRGVVTDDFWRAGIPVTSAYAANAVPVAEFTFAQIILALKKAQRLTRLCRENRRWGRSRIDFEPVPGCFDSTVGVVSPGTIGAKVVNLLKNLDLKIKVYDIAPDQPLSDPIPNAPLYVPIEEIFAECDVISLHTALLPETAGMITRELLFSMKEGAALINTARGGLIDEQALIEVLTARPDITAHLDVLHPEPPAAGSPLFALPNLFITPHIAGSMGSECRRMGESAIAECRRFLAGEPLRWQVTREMMGTMA